MLNKAVTILLVDDDEVDVKSLKRAFRKMGIANPVAEARNGIEALAILRGQGPQPSLPRPYIILLDLNMPRMNGFEFLAELRSDPALRDSVVFVFSTSKDEQDVLEAYRYNVAGYMTKSDPCRTLIDKADMVHRFLGVVELVDA